MVATSIAARGLDVPDLLLVINFDSPNHYEDYVHRCGRTGRAGKKGFAYTFLTPDEDEYAPDLIKALRLANTTVPDDLAKLGETFMQKLEQGKVHHHSSGFIGSGYKFDEAEEAAKKEQEKAKRRALLGDEGEEEEESHVADSDDETHTNVHQSSSKPSLNNTSDNIATSKDGAPNDEIVRGSQELGHFEAELEINDYPQQARWKVTHKVCFLFFFVLSLSFPVSLY
jgi:ATP-dependent RNA helicase DDX46/PRP5